MKIDYPVDDNIRRVLEEYGFDPTTKTGLWLRKDGDRVEYIDFRKGNPSIYSYEENEAVEVGKDLKKIRRRIRAEVDKENGGQKTLM